MKSFHRSSLPGRGALGALVMAGLTLLSVSASASNFEYMVREQRSQTDGAQPALVLQATDIINSGQITIESAATGKRVVKLSKMNPGGQKVIELKVPAGEHTFKALIEAKGIGDVSVTLPLEFTVVRVPPLTLQIDRDRVDTGAGLIPFRVNAPLDRVELEFFDTHGQKIGDEVQRFDGQSGDLELRWKAGAELGGIHIKAYDKYDFWTSVQLEPWWIEIEHEEIIFDFGKATWQASEEPKLKKSLKEIRDVMAKNERHRAEMRLFVAGYTDTVGGAAQNQKLSEERARAIAQWFKKNGVNMKLYYQGFGESALAVQTPDETAEERNRRALYILGNATPPRSAALPRSSWKPL